MELTEIDRIIIDEFKLWGHSEHPGCSPRKENRRRYSDARDLLSRRGIAITEAVLESRWKELKRWWVDHQKNLKHPSYRGERCLYECPIDAEGCVRMAFISVCDCYRHLYEKNLASLAKNTPVQPPLIILD